MDNKIKQRILGGVLIGAVVIIAIPFFTGHNHQAVQTKTITIDAPIPPLSTSSTPVATPAPALAPLPTAPAQPESAAPVVQNNSVPVSSDSTNNADQTPPLTVTDEQTQTAPAADTTDQTSTPADANAPASSTTQPAFDPNAAASTPAPLTAPTAASTTTPAFNPQATPAPSTPAVAQPVSQTITPAATSVKTKPTQVTQHTAAVSNPSNAWAVQVGSFSKTNNATQLVNHLKSRGLPVYTQTITTSHGKIIRVFIGPEAKHARAEAIVMRLQRHDHIQAVVVPYSTSVH